jgi:hypothetical protein
MMKSQPLPTPASQLELWPTTLEAIARRDDEWYWHLLDQRCATLGQWRIHHHPGGVRVACWCRRYHRPSPASVARILRLGHAGAVRVEQVRFARARIEFRKNAPQ